MVGPGPADRKTAGNPLTGRRREAYTPIGRATLRVAAGRGAYERSTSGSCRRPRGGLLRCSRCRWRPWRARRNRQIPRDPNGRPDLQGIWSYATVDAARTARRACRQGDVRIPTRSLPNSSGRPFSTGTRIAATAPAPTPTSRAPTTTSGGTAAREVLGRQTSLVVDPPDGRIPALTPQAQQRQAAARRSAPCDHDRRRQPRGSQPVGALHHARAADAARRVQQQHQDRADQGLRDGHAGDDSRGANHPDRRPSAQQGPPVARQLARTLGRRHARRRNDQLHRQDELPRRRREPEARRALLANRRRHADCIASRSRIRRRSRSRGRCRCR